jgi:hypothetical protein
MLFALCFAARALPPSASVLYFLPPRAHALHRSVAYIHAALLRRSFFADLPEIVSFQSRI